MRTAWKPCSPFARSLAAAYAICALLSCSSYDASSSAVGLPENTCTTDLDCGSGERCNNGMCVLRMTAEQNLVLKVTPEFMPDGTDAIALFSDLSRIDGATSRNVELPLSVPVHVRMLVNDAAVPGEVRFTPSTGLPGLAITGLSVNSADGLDTTVTLPNQATILMRAVPTSPTLPPLEKEVLIKSGATVEFRFDTDFVARDFQFEGLPDGVDMQVQAYRADNGRRISSIATIDSGVASLIFAPVDVPYQLEITAVATTDVNSPACGMPGTLTPSFRVPSDALPATDNGPYLVTLPQTLPSIDYQGSVQLCSETAMEPQAVNELTMTLRSDSLLEDSNTLSDMAEAYYQQDVRVNYNSKSGQLEFCAPAIPGDYEVVVNTPPTLGTCVQVQGEVRCGCGIFAEKRLIQAPPGSTSQVGATLNLPTLASISGTLTTESGETVMGASIEAAALGVAEGIELAADDPGLTQYNRSRQATSSADGTFRVPLDVGAYDVTIKPADRSGFSWLVVRDVRIANRSEEFVQQLTMGVPISVSGTLSYKNGKAIDNASLAGALIQVYRAVAVADHPDQQRTIALGQTTADENGNFTLLLPATIRDGWL